MITSTPRDLSRVKFWFTCFSCGRFYLVGRGLAVNLNGVKAVICRRHLVGRPMTYVKITGIEIDHEK